MVDLIWTDLCFKPCNTDMKALLWPRESSLYHNNSLVFLPASTELMASSEEERELIITYASNRNYVVFHFIIDSSVLYFRKDII